MLRATIADMLRRLLRSYWPLLVIVVFGIAGAVRAHLPPLETARNLLVTLAVFLALVLVSRQVGKGPWI